MEKYFLNIKVTEKKKTQMTKKNRFNSINCKKYFTYVKNTIKKIKEKKQECM